MKYHRIALGLISFALLIVIPVWFASFPSHSQENQLQRQSEKGLPDGSKYPVVDYAGPRSHEKERLKKSSRYDMQWSFVRPNPDPAVTRVNFEDESPPPEAIPTESDLIVTGQVLDAKAYLTNDKRNVYSEFVIRINEILKHDEGKNLVFAETITSDRMGGRVRYPDGREVVYEQSGRAMPSVGATYVFFLTKDTKSPTYRILTGYEIAGDKIEPLDRAVKIDEDKHRNEMEFLKAIRAKVALGRRNE